MCPRREDNPKDKFEVQFNDVAAATGKERSATFGSTTKWLLDKIEKVDATM